jgi:hypothetical protein
MLKICFYLRLVTFKEPAFPREHLARGPGRVAGSALDKNKVEVPKLSATTHQVECRQARTRVGTWISTWNNT